MNQSSMRSGARRACVNRLPARRSASRRGCRPIESMDSMSMVKLGVFFLRRPCNPEKYVTNDMHFTLDLPSAPDAIPTARRAIERLAPSLDAQALLNLRLLVSELVTNAVRHAPDSHAAAIELVVWRTDEHVRVEVADRGPGFVPAPRSDAAAGDRASGWGLYILAKVASRWGVERDGGARVWFEIDAPTPGRHAAA